MFVVVVVLSKAPQTVISTIPRPFLIACTDTAGAQYMPLDLICTEFPPQPGQTCPKSHKSIGLYTSIPQPLSATSRSRAPSPRTYMGKLRKLYISSDSSPLGRDGGGRAFDELLVSH